MATPMALLRVLIRPANIARFSSLRAVRTNNGASDTIRQKLCMLSLPLRQYSDKVLEGMGEFVEEEAELDLSPLSEPPIPQRAIDQPWKQTRRWHAKQYGKYGEASGVDPAIMWPTKAELKRLMVVEEQYFPSLQQMQAELAAEKQAADIERLKREKLIAGNMAKMPKMIADYRKQKRQEGEKLKEQKAKRTRLLAVAKEKLGYAVDPRSPRFKQMVEDIEAEEKKRRKELKKKGIIKV